MIICEAKTFEFIRYNLHQLLFWWILLPKTINSLFLMKWFSWPRLLAPSQLYICCKISGFIIITRKIRLLRVCSEWLNILITSYSKEAINTGTFKHVFLRESKFFKKGYIIHSNVVRSSHRTKVQNKHIDVYFFTAPIYYRSVMTGSYKNNKVRICFILPQRFWKKGRMSGLIKKKNFVIVIN